VLVAVEMHLIPVWVEGVSDDVSLLKEWLVVSVGFGKAVVADEDVSVEV
jgi:hypothetical protein